MLCLTRVHCSYYGKLCEKAACWKLHLLFSNGTSREGEGGNKCCGPNHIRVICCDYYCSCTIDNGRLLPFDRSCSDRLPIFLRHILPLQQTLLRWQMCLYLLWSLPWLISCSLNQSAMPDWALINKDCCAQRPCPPYCAVSTNANTLACKTVLERLCPDSHWHLLTLNTFVRRAYDFWCLQQCSDGTFSLYHHQFLFWFPFHF